MAVDSSVYRGICVDAKDPQGLGRIRVQVPQVLGPRASGWAFPAWSFGDLDVWPEDRIPKAGQGVWVMFEHPDRMTWLAAYGEQEFSNQKYDWLLDPDTGLPVAYETSMAWELPVLPADIEVPIAGTLFSLSGVPQPYPEIVMEKSLDRTAWVPAGPDPVSVDKDGSWSFEYTRPAAETGWWYRAVYVGDPPFWPAKTPEEQIPNPPTDTALTISPFTPAWQRTSAIVGTLKTLAAVAIPNVTVRLYQRTGTTGPWSQASTAVTDKNGAWTTTWFWKKEWTTAMQIKAVYLGNSTYDFSESTVKQLADVTVPVAVTWNFPASPNLNQTYVLSGTCTTADYGPPVPPTVQVQYRAPSASGTWTAAANVPIAENGTWSSSHTFTAPDADYRAYYPASGVYQEGSTAVETRVISLTTTTTAPSVPAHNHGSTITATGTIRDQTGALVTGGTAVLEYQETGGAWTGSSAGTRTVTGAGAYSFTHGPVAYVGPAAWRVRYLGGGGGFYLTSTSASTSVTSGMGTVGTPNKVTVTHNYAEISWGAVSGATNYEVYRNDGYVEDSTDLAYGGGGLAQNTDYWFYVRARRQSRTGTWIYGGWSATIRCNTGNAEVRKSGSAGYEARPYSTGTYRPSDGWGYNGNNLAQGYYSASSNNGFAVITYDGGAFRQWVADRWGWDTVNNLNFTHTQVAMYRMSGAGTGSAVTMWWHVTDRTAHTGGQPALAGGANAGSLTPGASAWVVIPYAHWGKHVLMNENLGGNGGVYTTNGFALYRPNSSEYAKFGGSAYAGNACNIYVEFNWNFVTVGYVAPRWY